MFRFAAFQLIGWDALPNGANRGKPVLLITKGTSAFEQLWRIVPRVAVRHSGQSGVPSRFFVGRGVPLAGGLQVGPETVLASHSQLAAH